MYTQLKQVMRDHGYNPSEGGDWCGTDTTEFGVFAHFVLALPKAIAHRFLAYPQAFPEAIKRLEEAAGYTGALPTPESQGEPEPEPAQVSTPAPVAAPIEDSTFDVSGKAPEAPPVETPPEVEAPPVVNENPETPPVEAPPVDAPPADSAPTEGEDTVAGAANNEE